MAKSDDDDYDCGLNSTDTKSSKSARGPVNLNKLSKRRIKGVRLEIEFNANGQPIGSGATEMQSFIGVLTRKEVKISYNTWKDVPQQVKDKIWESVNLAYIVDPKWKTGCWESACSKWRQWKTNMYKKHILPNENNIEKLKVPPRGKCIAPQDWSHFVISRMSDEFKKLSAEQSERRMKIQFPHRLSRTGYAGLAEKMKDELCGDDEIDRAIMWKKARVKKDEDIEDENLKKTVEKIDEFIQQKEEGIFKRDENSADLLGQALEKPEHPGRVRAIGRHVTPTIYFKKPHERRHRTQKEYSAVEMNETKKKITALDSNMSEVNTRLAKIEALISTPHLNLAGECKEERDSCSVKFQASKRKEIRHEEEEDDGIVQLDEITTLKGKAVTLTIGSKKNIVAYGTIIGIKSSTIHGLPFPKDCLRVSVDEAVDRHALLPFSIPNVCDNVGDAIGSHVAWPKHSIVVQNKVTTKKKAKFHVVNKMKVTSDMSLPSALKMLKIYAERILIDGMGILVKLDGPVFGSERDCYVHSDDILPFCSLEPISANCIVVYIWHLYTKMKMDNMGERYRFVDPSLVSFTGKKDMTERARALASRLKGTQPDQLVLVPCNVGQHWILTVIAPYEEVVYLLDPISHRLRDEHWKQIVNMAIAIFNANLSKKGKKNPTWEVIKAPLQPDAKQCGYYVMRYMKVI